MTIAATKPNAPPQRRKVVPLILPPIRPADDDGLWTIGEAVRDVIIKARNAAARRAARSAES